MKLLSITLLLCFGISLAGSLSYLLASNSLWMYDFITYYSNFWDAFFVLIYSAISVCIGFMLFNKIVQRPVDNNQSIDAKQRFFKFLDWIKANCLPIGVGFLSFYMLFDGWTTFPERTGYIIDTVVFEPFAPVAGLAGLVAIVILGASYGVNIGIKRWISFLLFLALTVSFFSKASRLFAFAPVMYFTIAVLLNRRVKLPLFIVILLSPFFMATILELRGLPVQGFLPFADHLLSNQTLNISQAFLDTYSNVTSSFYILSETLAQAYWLSASDMWVSLNPLPGSYVGWYEVSDHHRINDAVPYSAVGEMFAFSTGFGVLFFFIFGMIVAMVNKNLLEYSMIGFIQLIALIYFCLILPMYNLRSVMRFIHLIIFLEVFKYCFFQLNSIISKKRVSLSSI